MDEMPFGLIKASGINPRAVREMNLQIGFESERGNERGLLRARGS